MQASDHFNCNSQELLRRTFERMPKAGKGDIPSLLLGTNVKDAKNIVEFYRQFPTSYLSRRIPLLLASTTLSMVIKRRALSPIIESLTFSGIKEISAHELGYYIDYQKAFSGLPRYTFNMSTLALAAALITVSNGHFPFAYLDLAGEAVLDKEQIICYPIHEYPNGDLVIRYGLTPAVIKSKIQEIDPRIVGVNCLTSSHHNDMMDVMRIVKELEKDKGEKIVTIVGGSHATALDEYLARNPLIDTVVRGEGEITLIELLYRLLTNQPYDDVKGISFRKEGTFIRNPDREFLNVDYLPWLARELVPRKITKSGKNLSAVSVYGLWHNGSFEGNGTVIMTSRGCWGTTEVCYNCYAGHMFGKLRSRSKENVLSELEYLADQGYSIISDDADQVVLPTEEFKWYCEEIIKRKLNERLKFVTPNGLFLDGLWDLGEEGRELMVRAGYTDLCIGLEGADNFVKNVLHKPITLGYAEEVLRSFRRISAKLGIPVSLTAFVMVGGPGASQQDSEETYVFLKDLKSTHLIDQILPFVSTIIPGSRFFDIFLEQLSNSDTLEQKLRIFGETISERDWERCKQALRDVKHGNISPLLTCFDDYHIWEKMRFGLPNFHEVFGQNPDYLSSIAAELHSLNNNGGVSTNKKVVRRG